MGLSPYSTPADGGLLCVILANAGISISIVKEIFHSILHVVGIHIASWENYSPDNTSESLECCGSPSESYMEEFRNRTPAIHYGSVHSCTPNHQECPVCLTEFELDAEINHLSCGHVFHSLCLEKWLKYWHVTCPLCRNYMLPQEEENTCPMWPTNVIAGSGGSLVQHCSVYKTINT